MGGYFYASFVLQSFLIGAPFPLLWPRLPQGVAFEFEVIAIMDKLISLGWTLTLYVTVPIILFALTVNWASKKRKQ